jgi:hypothetical protein
MDTRERELQENIEAAKRVKIALASERASLDEEDRRLTSRINGWQNELSDLKRQGPPPREVDDGRSKGDGQPSYGEVGKAVLEIITENQPIDNAKIATKMRESNVPIKGPDYLASVKVATRRMERRKKIKKFARGWMLLPTLERAT